MKKLAVLVIATILLIVSALFIGINVVPLFSSTKSSISTTPFTLASTSTITSTTLPNANLTEAADFIEKLFNPAKGLCRETLVEQNEIITASNGSMYPCYTNETYWIASDNYLESLALSPYNATLSELINQTCSEYYIGSYFPYQIMQGEAIPTTLHVANTYILENTSDDQVVALNLYNGTVDSSNYLDYPTFGDALVYEAVNYYVQGYPLDWCDNLYMQAYNMFDGKGVADAHFQSTSEYDNMKLALLIFGAKVLNLNVDLTAIEQQLWSAQKTSGVEMGGITSLMDSSGQPIGTANGETTALTLLAYDDNLIKQIQQERSTQLKSSIYTTFSAGNFNQTASITTNLTAIPLLNNWSVTFNNTVQWGSPVNSPCVAIGFFSSLASPANPSIQIIEYYNGVMDVVIHNASNPNGLKVTSMSWSNPLTISLISGVLNISSSAGTFNYSLSSFPLSYITAGSTDVSYVCYGGEVDIQVPPSPPQTSPPPTSPPPTSPPPTSPPPTSPPPTSPPPTSPPPTPSQTPTPLQTSTVLEIISFSLLAVLIVYATSILYKKKVESKNIASNQKLQLRNFFA